MLTQVFFFLGVEATREKNIELLEKVQRRALRMIDEFKEMHYVDILRIVGLSTLGTRRPCGDLIEVFKIIKGAIEKGYRKKYILQIFQY